jgi:hypothetical protein
MKYIRYNTLEWRYNVYHSINFPITNVLGDDRNFQSRRALMIIDAIWQATDRAWS